MASILIVEDEKSTAMMLKHALSEAGHEVRVVSNGNSAVSAAVKRPPDLVVMDMSLPKMNGWDATRQIKADPATQHVPVLGLSGATTNADRDEAYNAGCEAYMTKPVNIPVLLQRISELTRT